MKFRTPATLALLLAATALATPSVLAKKKKSNQVPAFALSEAGKAIEADYHTRFGALKAELEAALPKVSESKMANYLKAREAETAAITALEEVKTRQSKVGQGQALVAHAKGKWIKGAEAGIAKAKADLKKAKDADQKAAAKATLAKWEQNLAEGQAALKERQALLDEALRDQPAIERDMTRAKANLERAKEDTLRAMNDLGLTATLTNDQLDAKLAKFHVIKHATPNRLAAFAEQGAAQRQLIERLLDDDKLLVQMAFADGARDGNYGQAMQILSQIEDSVSKPLTGILQRLAVAVALEHASPITQRNAVADSEAPFTVDPVKRFRAYAAAYTKGELDPAFDRLRTWDLRMVVNGEEPDHIAAWGREMLRNYRPDHITTQDYRWRYAALVRSDVRYGSQDNQYDEDQLNFFQNILKNGGICGRRAFIGRFILRAFGIPTIARPQRGHAALGHWTPDGWVVCLGGGWGAGYTKTRYKDDLDFLAATQARATGAHYLRVKRAQWIGDVAGERPAYGLSEKNEPGFWYGISLYTQKALIAASEAKTLAAVGEDIGEANETEEEVEINEVTMTKEDLKASVSDNGVITVPASATSDPTKSTGKIIFMNSVLGGKQLHYSRTGKPTSFTYKVKAPREGSYTLSARVCTPSWQQNLNLKLNTADQPVTIPLPYTVGMWGLTDPVTVELKRGTNTLEFNHSADGQAKGFTIKEFILTPVNG